ncbi:MAG: hypothetical protein GTO71_13530 [Woeseiaceae bacterium]|nr:hypothetical protein [Woeseiaceae bacterium]NIP22084.1 hypothetical protein [Woeseiaceae bacterium]NIS91198.1 hypothetical protein [Woeseiaceae bacterium]
MTGKLLFAALILCMSTTGCASGETTADETSSGTSDCFYIRNVNGWSSLDRKHVYIKEGVSKHYLLTLFASCPGLRYANAIALSNHMGRMCPNDFGAITFRDSGMLTRCRITNVEAVTSREEAAALAEARSATEEEE